MLVLVNSRLTNPTVSISKPDDPSGITATAMAIAELVIELHPYKLQIQVLVIYNLLKFLLKFQM